MPDLSVTAAQAHIAGGRFEQARAVLAAALARAPGNLAAMSLLTWVLMQQGQMDQARFYAQRAVDLRPDADNLFNLGKLLLTAGDTDRAIQVFERAVAADPHRPSTLGGLTNALYVANRFADAERLARQGLARWPGDAELLVDLAMALHNSGRTREAVPILRGTAAMHPDDPVAATMYANTSTYAGDLDPREVFEAHAHYGRLVERAHPSPPTPTRTDPNPDRTIRLGILSGDLRTHAVGFFIEPLIEHHDRAQLHITCYSTSLTEDATSRRLKSMSDGWRAVAHLPTAPLADQIRRDRIDILVELSGHTAGHRLPVFQLRPAPIGATYFGYPNTTGLRSIDYRIVDSITDPPEPRYDSLATEKLYRLDPCFLCYKGPAQAPAPAPPPSASGAPFTFGSFNNLAKHDDLALDLYRRVLDAVPGSRFMLKYGGLGNPLVREAVLRRFTGAGIPADRLILDPPGKTALETLPAYGRMDVMLDSFPYHGTTTTCEALFMGVPVISLEGRVCAARVGKSILSNVGHPELVAATPDEYVSIAASLASDPPRLATIRADLRPKLLASPVGNGPAYARRFEGMLRDMWQTWCRTQTGR